MSKIKLLGVVFVLVTCVHSVRAMVFDNRFLPLLQQPHLSVEGTRSEFSVEAMFATANKAFDEHQNDIPLPEIYGGFDQGQIALSMVQAGMPNPLPSEFQGFLTHIPWTVTGKRQMQGVRFYWHQNIVQWLSTGFSWAFMRVNSYDRYFLNQEKIEPRITIKEGDALLLDDVRRSMLRDLCLCEGDVHQSGISDIDWYVRFGKMREYTMLLRRLDMGLRFGALFATGQSREIGYPQSIPFGGDGHYGIYGAIDGMFEVRENWKTGFLFRVNKRFANTKIRRMPVGKEPFVYGPVIGPALVDPGVTVIFDPYVLLEGVRAGLGLGLNYTLIWHMQDEWCDRRCGDNLPVVNFSELERTSQWASEYFTIDIIYDFGKTRVKREFDPIVTFRWDIPSSIFIAQHSSRTYCVSLGVEFVY